eukprot:237203_1
MALKSENDDVDDIKQKQEDKEDKTYFYFQDSIYQFFWLNELRNNDSKVRDIHCGDRCLALCTLLCQIALYIYLIAQTNADLTSDLVPVEIQHGACGDVKSGFDEDTNEKFISDTSKFECEAGEENIGPVFFAVLILAQFIAPDMAGAVQLIRQARGLVKNKIYIYIASILIMIEGILAMIAGAMFAKLGNLSSGIDAFLGCVGVAFIHDIDEKIRSFFVYMSSIKMYLICMLISVIFGFSCVIFSIFAATY